jgi:hypothetical protein
VQAPPHGILVARPFDMGRIEPELAIFEIEHLISKMNLK